MLLDKRQVQDNLRNREGKRVFYLAKGDILTSDARDFLTREHIAVLPAEQAKPESYRLLNGGTVTEKPEQYTHLNAQVLVPKTHPRIRFRGMVDTLEAALLRCIGEAPRQKKPLEELLELARKLIRCDVLEQPVGAFEIDGLDEAQQRQHSHFPQKYYGIPHFMPQPTDPASVLALNWVRCIARQTELAAVAAFTDENGCPTRGDILQAMNRMSSMLYILMIREKAE